MPVGASPPAPARISCPSHIRGRGNGQVLTSLLQPVGTLIQLAKSELGNEGPHAARLGKGERLAEVAFALRAGLW
jgi:hypothetical protein